MVDTPYKQMKVMCTHRYGEVFYNEVFIAGRSHQCFVTIRSNTVTTLATTTHTNFFVFLIKELITEIIAKVELERLLFLVLLAT